MERTPLVRELTYIVVADAIRSMQLWADAGSDLGVSVNVPYKLVDDPQFVDGLTGLLQDADVPPGRLTLEIVPAGPGAGSELDEEVLRRIAELGVRLSLDDGGRASSFAALRVLGPRHRFSVNTQELDLTVLPRGDGLSLHLTGTEFFAPVRDAELDALREFWPITLESESPQLYRGEYLLGEVL